MAINSQYFDQNSGSFDPGFSYMNRRLKPKGSSGGLVGETYGDMVRRQNTAGQNYNLAQQQGYYYDPVRDSMLKSPTAQGEAVSQFSKAAMGGLMGAMGGNMSLTGGAGGGGTGGSGGGYDTLAGVADVDTSAANSAAFARAKDVAGKNARAEIESLRGVLGETGQLGGGAEAAATRGIIEDAAGQVGQVSREQAIQAAQQAQQNAIINYQGGITQRGQNIQHEEAMARLAQEANQAAWQRQMQLISAAMSGLGGLQF